MKERKVGEVKEGRIPVYDSKGNLRGNLGPAATSIGAARFTKELGAKLDTKDGRQAWVTPPKPKPQPQPKGPALTLADTSAEGTTEGAPALPGQPA
jgi:hypothetical protein